MTRLLALAGLLALAACAPRSRDIIFLQSAGAPALAVDDEIELGRQIERAVFERLGLPVGARDGAAPLQQSFERLGGLSERPRLAWRVHVIQSPAVNAVALPGGGLIVTSGLVGLLGERELQRLLAHEVGHLSLGHLASAVTVEEGAEQVLRRLRDVSRDHAFTPIEEARAERAASHVLAMARVELDDKAWVVLRRACTPEAPGYAHDHGLESWAGLRGSIREAQCVPEKHDHADPNTIAEPRSGAVRLVGVGHTTNPRGQQVYTFEVENASARNVRRVAVDLLYLDAKDQVVYRESTALSTLKSGGSQSSLFVLKATGYVNLRLVIGEIAYE
jgi:hypothetical protein